ncbi:MAG: DUF4932 domain-containing protein [Melioribacteraceae bacterium]|nr:DUF4932 domain-containing protein [Melioribacteraceae bacterium]
MRKIILICLLFLFYSGCGDSSTEPIYDEIPLEEEIQLNSPMIVKVDTRIELLSVVQHFTTWADRRHTKYESRYKEEVEKYFKKYSGHEAVRLSQELTDKGFTYDAPPNFVLYHSNPPDFNQETEYSDYLIARAGSGNKLESFANALRKFAQDTDFPAFIGSQKAYFIKIENDIKRTIGNKDYIQILEDYYGSCKNNYYITPASLFHAGGYGALVQSSEGEDVYNICGPLGSSKGIPDFGDESYFQYIMLHEFSHSFVNPVTEANVQEVYKYDELFEPIRDRMAAMAYGDWRTCVNEHLVRVNVARFFNSLEGVDKCNEILESEYQKGFIYIHGLNALMQSYEADRSSFPDYVSFYPEILKFLNQLNDIHFLLIRKTLVEHKKV